MHWHLMGRGNDAAKHSTMCIPTSMIRTYAAQIVNSTEIKKKKNAREPRTFPMCSWFSVLFLICICQKVFDKYM